MLKKRGLIAISALLAISASLGGATGYFLGTMFKPVKAVENSVFVDQEVQFSKNHEAVKKLFSAAKVDSIDALSNVDVTSLVGVGGLTIGDIAEASQLIFYDNSIIKGVANNSAYSSAMGVVNRQVTNSTWIKKDNLFFKENISYSNNAQFAERTYNLDPNQITMISKPLENKLKYFRTNKLPEKNASRCDFSKLPAQDFFVNTPENEVDENGKPIKSYSTTFGASIYKPFNYEFKESNLLKGDDGKSYPKISVKNTKTEKETEYQTKISKTDTGYEIDLVFTIEAMENYASYIYTTTRDASNIAKMKEKPKFVAVGAKLVTDKKLRPTLLHTDESYNVISNLVGAVPTLCTNDLTFEYGDEKVKIPTIKESIVYGK